MPHLAQRSSTFHDAPRSRFICACMTYTKTLKITHHFHPSRPLPLKLVTSICSLFPTTSFIYVLSLTRSTLHILSYPQLFLYTFLRVSVGPFSGILSQCQAHNRVCIRCNDLVLPNEVNQSFAVAGRSGALARIADGL